MENVILAICCCGLIMCFVMLVKNFVTYAHHALLIDAIFQYHMNCIRTNTDMSVEYTDMQSYNKTLLRLHDWSYKNILPPEKFEIIKPFIE